MMLASEGPSIYGRSPPAGFLSDCGPLWMAPAAARAPEPPPLVSGLSAPALFSAPRLSPLCVKYDPPSKSCLQQNNIVKERKKVVFADDNGLELAQVRVMPEPSNVPPFWTVPAESILETPKALPFDKWELRFAQPASEYVSFRKRISEHNVALENVIINEDEGYLTGTVKVKNLDFNKEVVIRSTSDCWRTCEDTTCSYSSSTSISKTVFDTFTFKIHLPTHSRRLEMCVCFKCLTSEFWDNNYGVNYIIEKTVTNPAARTETYFGRVRTGSLVPNVWPGNGKQDSTPYW